MLPEGVDLIFSDQKQCSPKQYTVGTIVSSPHEDVPFPSSPEGFYRRDHVLHIRKLGYNREPWEAV